ncbi:Tetraspanin, partial [Operophtera brumata]
ITGLIILIVGIKAEINASPYIDLTDENFYKSAPVVLILVGIVVFIVAFFGCCGAVKENHCMIVTFSVFLLIIFVAELAVGIAGYMKHAELETSIMKNLNASIAKYNSDANVKKTFDIVQTDLECCGINGPGDWKNNSLAIPPSCCDGQVITGGAAPPCTPDSTGFHKEGCLTKLVTHLQQLSKVLGGVGLGIAFIQVNIPEHSARYKARH